MANNISAGVRKRKFFGSDTGNTENQVSADISPAINNVDFVKRKRTGTQKNIAEFEEPMDIGSEAADVQPVFELPKRRASFTCSFFSQQTFPKTGIASMFGFSSPLTSKDSENLLFPMSSLQWSEWNLAIVNCLAIEEIGGASNWEFRQNGSGFRRCQLLGSSVCSPCIWQVGAISNASDLPITLSFNITRSCKHSRPWESEVIQSQHCKELIEKLLLSNFRIVVRNASLTKSLMQSVGIKTLSQAHHRLNVYLTSTGNIF